MKALIQDHVTLLSGSYYYYKWKQYLMTTWHFWLKPNYRRISCSLHDFSDRAPARPEVDERASRVLLRGAATITPFITVTPGGAEDMPRLLLLLLIGKRRLCSCSHRRDWTGRFVIWGTGCCCGADKPYDIKRVMGRVGL